MKIIGVNSGKVYGQGKYKSELSRLINERYGSYKSGHRKSHKRQILPESMKFVSDDFNCRDHADLLETNAIKKSKL